MGPPPPPPSRLVNPGDYHRVKRVNEANYRRWLLTLQCWMLIVEDRKARGEYVH